MCKRSEPDPLLRLFVDLYNLHLLAIPRENSSVGDLYVHDGRRTSAPGSVTHFLTPRFTLPPAARDERMADVAGTLSQGVDVKVGLGLLEGFLTAMGGGGLIGETKAEFVRTGTRTLRFRFGEATRDSIDPFLLGGTLAGHAFDKGNAVHGEGYRYYLVTAVARSRSIGVTAERERTMSAELNVEALKVADVGGGVTIRKSSQGEVTFAGDKALAFGVELYELVEGEHGEGMRLRAPRAQCGCEAAGRHHSPSRLSSAEWRVMPSSRSDKRKRTASPPSRVVVPNDEERPSEPMRFLDFEIRAWRAEGAQVAVLVHSSPVGEMRQPCRTTDRLEELAPALRRFREVLWWPGPEDAPHEEAVALGRALSSMLLPPPVYALLRRSLERVPPSAGIRLRLCLDEALIDLPWELLFDPDEGDGALSSGFLALSGRVSLVRCAAVQGGWLESARDQQRLAYAGALSASPGDDDLFEVRAEHAALTAALAKIGPLVAVEAFVDASGDNIGRMLTEPAAIFHYAGHADVDGGRGLLVRSHDGEHVEWIGTESLAPMLRRAGTRLVVINACNGGCWPVVKPLLRADVGVAAVIGIQGQVDNESSIAFCGRLYEALALGLSLDEAVTWGRLHIFERAAAAHAAGRHGAHAWPRFMVYMPTPEAVFFPQPSDPALRRLRERAREGRAQTIIHVTQIIGAVYGGSVSGVAQAADASKAPDAPDRTEERRMPDEQTRPVAKGNAARDYIELTIELRDVDEDEDSFVVSALPSPVGDTSPVRVPLRLQELTQDLARLERKMLTFPKLMAFGERLGDRLFPAGEVRDLLRAALGKAGRSGGVRVRLVIRDPRLAQLPWEYAYIHEAGSERHRSRFLLLNPQLSLVRHEVMRGEPVPLAAADPRRLRVVIATAGVTRATIDGLGEIDFAPLDVALEREAIVGAVRNLVVDGVTVEAARVLDEVTDAELTTALLGGADVFHFAGHGLFATAAEVSESAKPSGDPGGFIVLHEARGSTEGRALAADDLAMTLQRAGVRVAVLGACESARRGDGSPWSAVAPAMVRRGLPAAVAMQYEVVDEQATAFSRMLYTALAAGLSLDEAVSAGRQALLDSDGGGGVEWGVPVLYMRAASGVLFPALAQRESAVGARLTAAIDQVVDTVAKGGTMVGIRADRLADRNYDVNQKARLVEGEMVGLEIGTVGRAPRGRRRRSPEEE